MFSYLRPAAFAAVGGLVVVMAGSLVAPVGAHDERSVEISQASSAKTSKFTYVDYAPMPTNVLGYDKR